MEMAGSALADLNVVHPPGLQGKALVKGGHAVDLGQGDVQPPATTFSSSLGR